MKPCPKYREQIATMAINTLENQPKAELRAHLGSCADCRSYLEEISNVARSLGAEMPQSDAQPSPSFHRNVVTAVATAKRRSLMEIMLTQFQPLWNWRVLISTVGMAVLAISAWLVAPPHSVNPLPTHLANQGDTKLQSNTDVAPTYLNYEMAASQSFDKFDELLTKEGNRTQQSPPIDGTSTSSLLDIAD